MMPSHDWYQPLSGSYSLAGFDSITKYQFKNETLLHEALNTGPHKELAQLGDAALLFCLVIQGRERKQYRGKRDIQGLKTRTEPSSLILVTGLINKVVSATVSNANLAQLGFAMGLDKYIVNNPAQGKLIGTKVMASTMEAIIGAVSVDCGNDMSVVTKVMNDLGICWPESD